MTAVLCSPGTSGELVGIESSPGGSRLSCADEVNTIRRYNLRNNSNASFATTSSLPVGVLIGQKENSPLCGSTSSLFSNGQFGSYPGCQSPRRSWSWTVTNGLSNRVIMSSPQASVNHFSLRSNTRELFEGLHVTNPDSTHLVEDNASRSSQSRTSTQNIISSTDGIADAFRSFSEANNEEPDEMGDFDIEERPPPFKRWLNVLKKKNNASAVSVQPPEQRWTLDDFSPTRVEPCDVEVAHPSHKHRKQRSSTSSVGLLTAVKTASITLASLSVYPRSRRTLGGASELVREGSLPFGSPTRHSYDSGGADARYAMDEGVWNRSVRRQRIIEEIVQSEESYVRDMKTLFNVYLSVLPKNTPYRRTICKAISQILHLHEDLIGQLRTLLRNSQPSNGAKASKLHRGIGRHVRWRSLEAAPPRQPQKLQISRLNRHSIDTSRPSLVQTKAFMADTRIVMELAKIFDKFMQRFLAYESYAAYNESFSDYFLSIKSHLTWFGTEKGIEALSTLTIPAELREMDSHKALSFGDLIIKPIQRICKYPLFFHDLVKYTPACDDPVAHAEIQRLFTKVQQLALDIDHALSNPEVRKNIEISWLLQERLQFEDDMDRTTLFEKMGRICLCGVLHVVYNTKQGVIGQYIICALYRSNLILATLDKAATDYRVVMAIPLINANVEAPDNAKGLQCHSAQFTWKLIFDMERSQYEIILSACSEKEEEVWKSRLATYIKSETAEYAEGRVDFCDIFCFPCPLIKTIGPAFGPFTNFSRRLSIQRAATLGSKSNPQQVIIKNTEAQRYSSTSTASSVGRSQSHMSPNHIPTLAPRRADRIKLEHTISDVWTKHLIPFPGMSTRRPDNAIRASASSVMRKLSMAGIAGNFSKRSTSYATLAAQAQNDEASKNVDPQDAVSSANTPNKAPKKEQDRPAIKVDFHTTPLAFLPADFGLDIKPPNHMNKRSRRLVERLSLSVDGPSEFGRGTRSFFGDYSSLRTRSLVGNSEARRPMTAPMLDGAIDLPERLIGSEIPPATTYCTDDPSRRTKHHIEEQAKERIRTPNKLRKKKLKFFM